MAVRIPQFNNGGKPPVTQTLPGPTPLRVEPDLGIDTRGIIAGIDHQLQGQLQGLQMLDEAGQEPLIPPGIGDAEAMGEVAEGNALASAGGQIGGAMIGLGQAFQQSRDEIDMAEARTALFAEQENIQAFQRENMNQPHLWLENFEQSSSQVNPLPSDRSVSPRVQREIGIQQQAFTDRMRIQVQSDVRKRTHELASQSIQGEMSGAVDMVERTGDTAAALSIASDSVDRWVQGQHATPYEGQLRLDKLEDEIKYKSFGILSDELKIAAFEVDTGGLARGREAIADMRELFPDKADQEELKLISKEFEFQVGRRRTQLDLNDIAVEKGNKAVAEMLDKKDSKGKYENLPGISREDRQKYSEHFWKQANADSVENVGRMSKAIRSGKVRTFEDLSGYEGFSELDEDDELILKSLLVEGIAHDEGVIQAMKVEALNIAEFPDAKGAREKAWRNKLNLMPEEAQERLETALVDARVMVEEGKLQTAMGQAMKDATADSLKALEQGYWGTGFDNPAESYFKGKDGKIYVEDPEGEKIPKAGINKRGRLVELTPADKKRFERKKFKPGETLRDQITYNEAAKAAGAHNTEMAEKVNSGEIKNDAELREWHDSVISGKAAVKEMTRKLPGANPPAQQQDAAFQSANHAARLAEMRPALDALDSAALNDESPIAAFPEDGDLGAPSHPGELGPEGTPGIPPDVSTGEYAAREAGIATPELPNTTQELPNATQEPRYVQNPDGSIGAYPAQTDGKIQAIPTGAAPQPPTDNPETAVEAFNQPEKPMNVSYNFGLKQDPETTLRDLPVGDKLMGALERTAQETGYRIEIFSGTQNPEKEKASNSGRHEGDAADVRIFRPDGTWLSAGRAGDVEEIKTVLRAARRNGITDIGAHGNYMNGDFHLDVTGKGDHWGANLSHTGAPTWLREVMGEDIGRGKRATGDPPRESLMAFVKDLEGYSPTAYSDHGQLSVGWGTKGKKGERITEAEAERRLASELSEAHGYVDEVAKEGGYNFTENQIDALVSFTFNNGPGNRTNKDKGLRALLLNNGKRSPAEIAKALLLYNKASGKVNKGLVNRRKKERDLFLRA